MIYAFYYLAEGTFIYDSDYFVAIGYLFARFDHIQSIFIGNRILIMSPHFANSIYFIVYAQLYLFKFGQFVFEEVQRLLWSISIPHLLLASPKIWLSKHLGARSLRLGRLSIKHDTKFLHSGICDRRLLFDWHIWSGTKLCTDPAPIWRLLYFKFAAEFGQTLELCIAIAGWQMAGFWNYFTR